MAADSSVSSIPDAKRAAVEERGEARASWKHRRANERRCFWTWPWGHVYKITKTTAHNGLVTDYMECAACKKFHFQSYGRAR